MGFLDFFKRKAALRRDVGMEAAHLELRRAIERCDALRPAFEAKQLSLADLVATLKRNSFSNATIRKAVEESLGEDVAKRI